MTTTAWESLKYRKDFKIDDICDLMHDDRDKVSLRNTAINGEGPLLGLLMFTQPSISDGRGMRLEHSGTKQVVTVDASMMGALFRSWRWALDNKSCIDDRLEDEDYETVTEWRDSVPVEFIVTKPYENGQAKIFMSVVRVLTDMVPQVVNVLVVGSTSVAMDALSYDQAAMLMTDLGFSGQFHLYDIYEREREDRRGAFVMHHYARKYVYKSSDTVYDIVLDDASGWCGTSSDNVDVAELFPHSRVSLKSFIGESQPFHSRTEKRLLYGIPSMRVRPIYVEGMDRCAQCVHVGKIFAGLRHVNGSEFAFSRLVAMGVRPCSAYRGQHILEVQALINMSVAKRHKFDLEGRDITFSNKKVAYGAATLVAGGFLDIDTQSRYLTPNSDGLRNETQVIPGIGKYHVIGRRRKTKDNRNIMLRSVMRIARDAVSLGSRNYSNFEIFGTDKRVVDFIKAEFVVITDEDALMDNMAPRVLSAQMLRNFAYDYTLTARHSIMHVPFFEYSRNIVRKDVNVEYVMVDIGVQGMIDIKVIVESANTPNRRAALMNAIILSGSHDGRPLGREVAQFDPSALGDEIGRLYRELENASTTWSDQAYLDGFKYVRKRATS